MNTSKAFLAGVIAGIAMTILGVLGRALGIPLNAEMILGTMMGLAPGALGIWFVGFLIHLVLSGRIALLYVWGFEKVTLVGGIYASEPSPSRATRDTREVPA